MKSLYYILFVNKLTFDFSVIYYINCIRCPISVPLPLKAIPVGAQIHNIEITLGKGGQIVKSAGSAAIVFGREEKWILIKLPSGEIRRFNPEAWATIIKYIN